jgi:two-component system NtrC family sensor kinase
MVMHDISQLKEVDRLKTNFVANVSQDLRSPLTAIMGYVELLSRAGKLNETQETFVDRIMLSAQSINSEITDLLDLSRIETSSSEINYDHVLLSTLLNYAIATLEGQLAAKQIDLIVEIEADMPQVWGNAQRLKQMIRNLLDNAMQFTPEQGRIKVTLRADDNLVMLQIEDNGIGISLEDQAHIFDKFYRAETVREEYEGAGLGLAIVKSILDRHDGRIWIESEPGNGATFTVLLPVGHAKQARLTLPAPDLIRVPEQ